MSLLSRSALLHRSPIPLYLQLKQLILADIEAGRWRTDERIPGDDELACHHGVSRTTVRQAMKELEIAGLIIRYRGRGTFLAKAKFSHSPEPPHRLTDNLRARGIRPGWRVLEAIVVPAPAIIASALAVAEGCEVFRTRRLRFAGDEVIGLVTAHALVSADEVPRAALEEGTSLHYLARVVSLAGAQVDRIIEAVVAGSEESHLLEVEIGAPLLHVRRILNNAAGVSIEHYRGLYRGDRFQYIASGSVHPIDATRLADDD